MKVVVTGATGTIGGALVRALVERGDDVSALSRSPERAEQRLGVPAAPWGDPLSEPPPASALSGRDAVVHLQASRSRSGGPPRPRGDPRLARARHAEPRGGAGRSAAGRAPRHPRLAVGHRLVRPARRRTARRIVAAGSDFLAEVTAAWEAEAARAEEPRHAGGPDAHRRGPLGVGRRAGEDASALQARRGRPGGGRGAVRALGSRDDVVGAMLFVLDTPAARGPVNVTAPEPVTNRELSRALGRVLTGRRWRRFRGWR